MQKLFPRLLGVLVVHAVLGALAWGLDRWLFVRQERLATDLLNRIDGDPAQVEAYLSDVGGSLLSATAGSLLLSTILGVGWLVAIHHNPPYGDKSARSRRGSWAALAIVAILGSLGLFWQRLEATSVADLLAPGVPVGATVIGVAAVVIAYWVSTAVFAPVSTKVAVPGASLLSR